MQNMYVEFKFKGKARLKEIWRLITKGQVNTFFTEKDILSIWKQYSVQRRKEQLDSMQPLAKTVARPQS